MTSCAEFPPYVCSHLPASLSVCMSFHEVCGLSVRRFPKVCYRFCVQHADKSTVCGRNHIGHTDPPHSVNDPRRRI